MTIQRRNYCGLVGKDKLIAYFVGIIGVSCIVFSMFGHHLSEIKPDILYVDKETLDVQRSGRYAILVTRKPYSNDTDEHLRSIHMIAKDAMIESSKYGIDKYMAKTTLNDTVKHSPKDYVTTLSTLFKHDSFPQKHMYSLKNTTYNFIIPKSAVENIFMDKKRNVSIGLCNKLFENNAKALIHTTVYMKPEKRKKIDNSVYRKMTQNCSNFIHERGYLNSSFTEIETNFPLAYSIVAYKHVEQIERLLRSIYRPHNHYCIHMDAKSSRDDMQTMKEIISCFPNVQLSSRSLAVSWGTFTVLEAELVCMDDIWNKTWRYFINLTGQEFPLKTNLEIVKILTAMHGANIVDGTWVRARENYLYRWTKTLKPPPHNIRPIKGSVHIAVNREFVDFALHDHRSKDFLHWLKQTDVPDETFFSSLNHNSHLQIPGTFLGEAEEYPRKPTFTRYKNWEIGHGVWVRRCSGKYVRNICILGVGDLHKLKDDIALFANKFYLDFQFLTYECLEELMYNRTRDQYLNELPIDVTFYESLDQVRYQYVKSKL